MSKKKKTRDAVRRSLESEETAQLCLFEVSDGPLRRALFDETLDAEDEEGSAGGQTAINREKREPQS